MVSGIFKNIPLRRDVLLFTQTNETRKNKYLDISLLFKLHYPFYKQD